MLATKKAAASGATARTNNRYGLYTAPCITSTPDRRILSCGRRDRAPARPPTRGPDCEGSGVA
jgi:hypothetical protein